MRRFETYTVPSPQIVGSTEARAWREYRELPWYKRWYFHVRAVFTGRPVPELVFDAMLEAMTNEINLEHAGLVWGNPAMVGDRLFGPIRRLALTAARLRPLIGLRWTLLSRHLNEGHKTRPERLLPRQQPLGRPSRGPLLAFSLPARHAAGHGCTWR